MPRCIQLLSVNPKNRKEQLAFNECSTDNQHGQADTDNRIIGISYYIDLTDYQYIYRLEILIQINRYWYQLEMNIIDGICIGHIGQNQLSIHTGYN